MDVSTKNQMTLLEATSPSLSVAVILSLLMPGVSNHTLNMPLLSFVTVPISWPPITAHVTSRLVDPWLEATRSPSTSLTLHLKLKCSFGAYVTPIMAFVSVSCPS